MTRGCTPGEDPAVLSWRIALAACRESGPWGRHWWREYVTEMFHAATHAREALRESGHAAPSSVAGTSGAQVGYYQLSDEEFEACHPAPRFKDFLVEFSQGRTEPPW